MNTDTSTTKSIRLQHSIITWSQILLILGLVISELIHQRKKGLKGTVVLEVNNLLLTQWDLLLRAALESNEWITFFFVLHISNNCKDS